MVTHPTSLAAGAPVHRLVGTARGDGHDAHTASGTAKGLFDALDARYGVAERLDVGLTRNQRVVAAGLAVAPRKALWRQRYWMSLAGFQALSRNSRQALEQAPPGTLAMQVYGMFHTRGTPFVMYIDTTHDMAVREWPQWSPFTTPERKAWMALERATYRDAAHVFTASQAAAASVRDAYGVPAERVSVVKAGSNFSPLPDAGRERPREPEILFIGREWERKGGPELLQAFRRVRAAMPEARLTIVGTREPRPEPGVEIVGKVMDREDLAARFEAASIYTVPSRFCPFTNSLMEAMAYSLPCVSTATAGVPECVLHERTGLVVGTRDARALGDALLRLLADQDEAERFGRAGRDHVERELTWERVVDRMAPVLEDLGLRPRARDPLALVG